MNKYLLELTVFICGASVMVLELAGSRILAPYVGTSLVVWTSLIGIILGSLSLGYYLGGKYADKGTPANQKLGLIIFISSIFVITILILRTPIMLFLPQITANLALQAVMATILLFALPSVFLGMVSPYAAKLKIESIKKAGGAVGNLYALSTLGSIFGTFLAGFYLIAAFSLPQIVLGIGVILFLNALLLSLKKNFFKLGLIFFLSFLTAYLTQDLLQSSKVLVTNTLYNSVTIFDTVDGVTQKPVRVMSLDNKYDSGMFLESEDMAFEYTKFYRMAKHINPDLKRVLVIGGAGYSIPKDFLNNYPDVRVDVVEIDPELTELAKKYFNLKDNPRLNTYHEDGRTFINRTAEGGKEKYDAIFIDAFKSYSMPFQLTTKEFINRLSDSLNDDGVVITNIISAIEGDTGKFLQAEYKTYTSVFPKVYLFPITDPQDPYLIQNVIFLGTKNNNLNVTEILKDNPEDYLSHLWQKEVLPSSVILTDDYAPVDQYFLNASL